MTAPSSMDWSRLGIGVRDLGEAALIAAKAYAESQAFKRGEGIKELIESQLGVTR